MHYQLGIWKKVLPHFQFVHHSCTSSVCVSAMWCNSICSTLYLFLSNQSCINIIIKESTQLDTFFIDHVKTLVFKNSDYQPQVRIRWYWRLSLIVHLLEVRTFFSRLINVCQQYGFFYQRTFPLVVVINDLQRKKVSPRLLLKKWKWKSEREYQKMNQKWKK